MPSMLDYFRTLSDPTRLKLLKLVSTQKLCVCNLVEIMGMSQPAVSNQLSKLKDLNLVKVDRRGQWSFYEVDPDGFRNFIASWERFWSPDSPEFDEPEVYGEEWRRYVEMARAGDIKSCEDDTESAED